MAPLVTCVDVEVIVVVVVVIVDVISVISVVIGNGSIFGGKTVVKKISSVIVFSGCAVKVVVEVVVDVVVEVVVVESFEVVISALVVIVTASVDL